MKIIVTPDDWSNARIVPSAELATAMGALAPGRYDLAFATATPAGAFEVKAAELPVDPAPVEPADPVEPELPIEPAPVDPLPPVDPVEPPVEPLPPVVAPGGTGAASVKITMRRGDQKLAPEGIAFFAEVSGFDATPPADGSTYDPTMHELYYTWTFGDPGEYAAPVNMLAQWRNKNVAYGPFPAHCFVKPGTYVVILTVNEPSSGKSAAAFAEVTVGDPNVVIPAATTVVCSSSENWSEMPAHDEANRTTTIAAAFARLEALKANGALTRLVFRGGDEFAHTTALFIGTRLRNCHISASGAATAIINCTAMLMQIYGTTIGDGASISGLEMRGPWDSTTETLAAGFTETHAPSGIKAMGGLSTIHNCTGSGFWQAFHVGSDPSVTAIFSEIHSTNWEDYGIWISGQGGADQDTADLTGYAAVLGGVLAQSPDALMGANGKSHTDLGNRHGSMRIEALGFVYVDAMDGFSRNGWSAPAYGVPATQNCIRDHRNDKRSRGFFTRLMFEGGGQQYSTGPNTPSDKTPFASCNSVIDKAYMLADAKTSNQISITSGAFTGRNILLHRPNVGTGSTGFGRSIQIGTGSTRIAEENKSAPVRFYNITIINEMDTTQQARWGGVEKTDGKTDWVPVEIKTPFFNDDAITIENVVVHRPNFPGGFVGDGPLDDARLGFVPRNLGYRWKNHDSFRLGDKLEMDTRFATPADPWSLWRSLPGSPAIGSATGRVAYDDLLGNIRPANASRGAIEPLAA